MVSTALCVSFAGAPARAMPEGSQITAGNAVIETPTPSSMEIDQASSKAIINWNSFSINSGEQVRFNQPSSSSLTVNRVTGIEASNINGKLSANGNIMIINGNGILFGQDAVVDVNGLVATTIDTTDQRILNNDFKFDISGNPSAKIDNHGKITASEGGLVALVAPGVENHGIIEAKLGKVTMASGDAFTIDLYGDGLVKFPATQEILQGGVKNSGTIKADGGHVALTAQTAKRVVDNVINMDGLIEAHSIGVANGEIILGGGGEGIVNVSGTIDASGNEAGEKGGKVKILGEKIGVFDNARIDASGDAGGGEILAGGNFQGKGPEQNSKATYVAKTAAFDTSSENGDAGRVIVWADEVTNYYGSIDASAGSGGGDGGFVEVSGKEFLDFQGTVDRSAVSGKAGTLLLDPRNVTISTGANTNMPGASPFDATGDSAILNTGTLVTALAAGDVIVSTGSGGAQAGDITVSNDIIATAGSTGSLTLNAANNISVNASIDLFAGTGSITLNADFDQSGAGIYQVAPPARKSFERMVLISQLPAMTSRQAIPISAISPTGVMPMYVPPFRPSL